MFCTNWLIFSKMKGSDSSGWSQQFSAIKEGVAAEAVNYTITLARGIFTIPASMILMKLGFRRACLLACGLATVALPLIFSPHWTVLLLGRLAMAAGGTLTIIYVSPLLSKVTLPEKKKKLAAMNGFTFALAGLLVNALFLISPVKSALVSQWKWTAGVTAGFSFVPLIIFYMYGKNFEIVSMTEKLEVKVPDSYPSLLKARESWNWIICYTCMLVVSVLYSGWVPNTLTKVFQFSSIMSAIDWSSLYTVVFFLGTCAGLYFLGKLNVREVKRTSVVTASTQCVLVAWAVMAWAAIMARIGQDQTYTSLLWVANILILVCTFWLAFFGLGIQSVFLYIPLEYKDYSPQKTSIFFSCLWGIGYIIFTGYYILASVLSQLLSPSVALGFLTIMLFLYYYFSTKLRESKPEYADIWTYAKENWLPGNKAQLAVV
ncbi:major facilitator superfamily transporter [Candidatus Mycoplasma haematolamae str. Purdue]|uniref:Major facilitator superfamily transporter n=1 Tax=Mycoplasma haematolamae (strain Purdue) TaxID=1212765 RepID=I7BIR2_MYCHA|nr:MFS transporter [Candidatus Mycoplasma haematolamae]AFO51713.1 major facilitator superfamily transporter [Candidatus Mycoplasma haematolamae str. Purdue]